MERLFIDRVRINECLCDSFSPTCLALAGLVQRTKPTTCRPCLSPTCLALEGLVQQTQPSICRPCAFTRLAQITKPTHACVQHVCVRNMCVYTQVRRRIHVCVQHVCVRNMCVYTQVRRRIHVCVYTSPRASWSPHPGPEEEDTCHVSTGPVGITAGYTDKLL